LRIRKIGFLVDTELSDDRRKGKRKKRKKESLVQKKIEGVKEFQPKFLERKQAKFESI